MLLHKAVADRGGICSDSVPAHELSSVLHEELAHVQQMVLPRCPIHYAFLASACAPLQVHAEVPASLHFSPMARTTASPVAPTTALCVCLSRLNIIGQDIKSRKRQNLIRCGSSIQPQRASSHFLDIRKRYREVMHRPGEPK